MKVNNDITMRLRQELQRCPKKRLSPKAISVITQFSSSFIQFPSFTSIKIVGFDEFPWKLPR